MRDRLAEALLASVMRWDDPRIAAERPILQAFADYKYDSYEQFQPGLRFIESLARWLRQFPEHQRESAYRLVRDRLVFISRAEMQHLVSSVYPDVVRPRLLERAADDIGEQRHLVARVAADPAFERRRRSCLFVGLSDGARTDVLRRANPVEVSNEQVIAEYSGLREKAPGMVVDLRDSLRDLTATDEPSARFSTVVLLDDFSASGISYLRADEPGKGKIAKTAAALKNLDDIIDLNDLEVMIVLYVATTKALAYLRGQMAALADDVGGRWTVQAVQKLGDDLVIGRGDDPDLDEIIETCYDETINDKHMRKGNTDGRYGFADGGLPLVLAHNTPNNALAIIWADTAKVRGLFPRVSRHREEP